MSKRGLYELFPPPLLLLPALLPESAFNKWAFPLCWVKHFLEIKPGCCSVHTQKNHIEQSGKIHAEFLKPAISLSTDKCAQASATVTSKNNNKEDFTGSPAVKILCLMQGALVGSQLGNKDPTCHGAQQKKKTTQKPSYLKGPFTLPDWVYHFVSFCYLIASTVKVTCMHCKLVCFFIIISIFLFILSCTLPHQRKQKLLIILLFIIKSNNTEHFSSA